MSRSLRTLTVRALRELLDGENDDALVLFTADYGDYHHTRQALPLTGETDTATVVPSAYSTSGFELVYDDDVHSDDGTCDECDATDAPHAKTCSRATSYLVIR